MKRYMVLVLLMLAILPLAFAVDSSISNVTIATTPPYYAQIPIYFNVTLTSDTNGTSGDGIYGTLTGYTSGSIIYTTTSARALVGGNTVTVQWNPALYPINVGSRPVRFIFTPSSSEDTNTANNTFDVSVNVVAPIGNIDLQVMPLPDLNYIDHNTTYVCVPVRNNGTTNATDVWFKSWHSSEVYSNTLHTSQINVTALQTVNVCFNYRPLASGTDTIIVRVDAENLVEETNENNNFQEKQITVNPSTDANVGTANAIDFDIRGECSAYIGNGDRFFSQGIDTNSTDVNNPNPIYKIKYQLVDGLGNTVMQGTQGAGYQLALSGRTLKIISVSRTVAKVMLIYPTQYTVSGNTCEVNVADLLLKYDNLQIDFQKIQAVLVEAQTKTKIFQDDSTTCKLALDKSNSANISCVANIATVSTNLGLCNDSCTKSKEDLETRHANDKNSIISDKDRQITEQADSAFAGWGLFFFTIIVVGFAMVMLKRTHILENKMN